MKIRFVDFVISANRQTHAVRDTIVMCTDYYRLKLKYKYLFKKKQITSTVVDCQEDRDVP